LLLTVKNRNKKGGERLKEELFSQLEELAKHAKKMAGHSTGQTFVTWKSIETKAKELLFLLKGLG